jgi:multidrug efflux pump subunit AcrB
MLASYALSRTLTPIIIGLLLKGEHHGPADDTSRSWFARFHRAFDRAFEQMRAGYARLLKTLLHHRLAVPATGFLILALATAMLMLVGRDFFPAIDGGQIKLHVRAPAATRIEATEHLFQMVEDKIREVIPEKDRDLIVDDIGIPQRAYNLAFTDGSTINANDGVILGPQEDMRQPPTTSASCARCCQLHSPR